MDTAIKLFRSNIRQYGMFIALILIMLLFQFLSDGNLLKPLNITNLILQNSYILILAIGMLLVIITGHIDLSVGSVAAFVGAVSAIMMVNQDMPFPVAMVLSLFIGAAVGAWQGFWVAYVRIPSFIVTLAGMLLFRGLTMLVLDGKSVAPFPDGFRAISTGFLPDIPGEWNIHLLTVLLGAVMSIVYIFMEWRGRLIQQRYKFEVIPVPFFMAQLAALVIVINLFTYVLASYKGLPNILIMLFILVAVYTFVMRKTVMGRHIYALGGNEKAARLSGVKTKKMTFWVFVNMGVLAALAGLVFAARLNAATPKAGVNFELDAIAAVFIGGASATGGVGTVIGAIVGGLVMGVMNNGMSLIGLGIDYQQGIKGLVLLLAVAFDLYNKNKSA
ncbi:ABC transporter permease [Paenibacillus darwinianus]|uniref:Xylose transport system permease protein XylH n=1 Tax=Paenibacillus darwinianus TaxID=1380763 RepID=A0A9W5RYJ1_9BACL|nr:multiple monosaccharide ABC transporter permease [Paenibacillus darwinianus]EXX84821.1 ABC transporter permease [Paenibacillus darwinianus]EXX84904.1 ABC transporter permease [Paenibacillus darwinianus]EXX85101.1 ABC transporter permease [Paenibacillus darwinianus]